MASNMQRFTADQVPYGATVYDASGEKLGTIAENSDDTRYMTVQKGWFFPKDTYVPYDAIARVDQDQVFLSVNKEDLQDVNTTQYTEGDTRRTASATTGTPLSDQDRDIRVPVREEELVVGKQREEQGRVRLHTDVVEEQQTINVPLQHERLSVERVAVNDTGDTTDAGDAFVERDIDVPLMGEEAVAGKRTKVVEEVRLHKDTVVDDTEISDTVRKERVVIDGDNAERVR